MPKIPLKSKLLVCFITFGLTGATYLGVNKILYKIKYNESVGYPYSRLSRLKLDPYLNPYKNFNKNHNKNSNK